MKKKILIIEDEYYFRQALKKYIGQYPEEFEVCGEARNGCDGLDCLMELRPDIALVDITMPLKDGISLIRDARKSGCDTKIIILTGYGEFEYAKQAIQLGVQDYLLKPLQSKELYESLKKVGTSIEKERETQDSLQFLSPGGERIRAIVREGLVKKLLLGEELDQGTAQASLELIQDGAFYMAGVVDVSVRNAGAWRKGDAGLCNYAVCNLLRDLTGNTVLYATCTNEEGAVSMALSGTDSGGLNQVVSDVMSRLGSDAERLLGLSVSVYLGTVRPRLEELPDSYSEALAIQKYQLFSDKQGVYFYANNCNRYNPAKNFFTSEDRKRMLSLLRGNDRQQLYELIQSIFDCMTQEELDADTVYMQVMDMISAILDFAAEWKLALPVKAEQFGLYSRLFSMQSLVQLKSLVWDTAAQVMAQTEDRHEDTQQELAQRIAAYIDAAYSDSGLKLEKLAGEFYMNVQYLCAVFKKHKGTTIGNYLLDVRMEHAKHEFDIGAGNITGVAHLCGYEDVGYFSKCFRRYYGVSPKKYLQQK